MNPKTFIFIGRSGCGKGTQAELLKKYLGDTTPQAGIFYLETGKRFRDFITETHATATRAKKYMEESKRQPDFLAVWMWSHVLVEELTAEADEAKHWVIDGTPRSLPEANVLDTAMQFYGRGKAYVVHLNVSRTWSEERLRGRKRADD
ncbi:MAG: nucleoside monophosphate kinase, partial [Patescibacteria group bacterium]